MNGELLLDLGVGPFHCGLWIADCGFAARFGAAEEPRDFVERSLRRGQADALRRALANRLGRSSDSARCAPRLLATSAWISSMMIVSTDRSASRAFEVSSR